MRTGVSLAVLNGFLVLLPDNREETSLRRELAHLEQQRREMGQARQKMVAALAWRAAECKKPEGSLDHFRIY